MGASESTTRVVTLEGDDGSTVVTISEAVARRLLGKQTGFTATPVEVEKREVPSSSTLSREELKTIESYYEKRLKAIEAQNEILRRTSEESFASAVKEVEEKFLKPLPSCSVCTDFQEAVSNCYRNNKDATINCAPEVKAFKNCVQKHREAVLERKGG